MYISIK